MEYFISDIHAGHENCIAFDSRPFKSVLEMNQTLINNCNKVVKNSDDLYILGDVAMKPQIAIEFLKKLNGKKHLILGNHDKEQIIRDANVCEEITPYKRIVISNSYLNEFSPHGSIVVCMSHYPMLDWDKKMRGSVHLFGHVHTNDCIYFDNNQPLVFPLKELKNAYNVFCGYQGYTPLRLDQILRLNGYYPDAYKPQE